jgi:4-phospho-D-threonate 3-dehydrogenase / 4-phospho-D-erythronate 3-dehydrogenase
MPTSDQYRASGRPAPRPLVAITMGDPAGIGPEIIAKALSDPAVAQICRTLVIGDAKRLAQAAAICGVRLEVAIIREPEDVQGRPGTAECIDLGLVPDYLPFGELSEIGGEAAYQAVRTAAALAVERRVDAICTAPLNKEALHMAGHIYPGHTEMLADLTGTDEVSMMLVSSRVRVIHVTTHVGLLDMVERIEPGLVYRTIKRGHDALVKAGLRDPRIAVCGINPHAGEHGLFGRGEEERKVQPGVEQAQSQGIDVRGPLPADTVFFRAGRGDFDLVVAMYHDQGHGPVKVLGLDAGVNVTVGLPVIRTSVDHGTAFDIAGKGKADHNSLIAALRQSAQLAAEAA